MNLKTPMGRLAKWALSPQGFNLHIDYIPGKRNVIADTLSRPPLSDIEETELVNMVSTDFPTKAASDIRREQLADLEKIILGLEALEPGVDLKTWCKRGYIMVYGILHCYAPEIDEEEPQQVVPKTQIPDVLKEYHDSELAGYLGIERTYQRLAARYYWPSIRRTITDYIGHCIVCQRFKPTNLKPADALQTPAMVTDLR